MKLPGLAIVQGHAEWLIWTMKLLAAPRLGVNVDPLIANVTGTTDCPAVNTLAVARETVPLVNVDQVPLWKHPSKAPVVTLYRIPPAWAPAQAGRAARVPWGSSMMLLVAVL